MIKFTWLSTASVLLDINGEKLVFDPFLSFNKKINHPSVSDFSDADYFFNTHPHFDHLCDVPEILKHSKSQIFGTPQMKKNLEKSNVPAERISVINEYDQITTQNAKITVLPSAHCKNDFFTVFQVVMRALFKFQLLKCLKILKVHKSFPMKNKIFSFQIESEDKTILLHGSAGYDESSTFAKPVDILIWAYQGSSDMARYSLEIIKKIRPKKVILTHFDDTFPPLTHKVNTSKFVSLMKKQLPQVEVIVPKFKEEIILN